MRILALSWLMIALACSSSGVSDPNQPMMVTDASEYDVVIGEARIEARISFQYANRSGRTIYFPNCNGVIAPILQQWNGLEWVFAWGSPQLDCLSPPVVLLPDEVYEDTLTVSAGTPGSNIYPQFQVSELSGKYRLLWLNALGSYDPDGPPWGESLPENLRSSNEFRLVAR